MRLLGRSTRGAKLVVLALLSVIPSARGWQCAGGAYFRSRNYCGRAEGRFKRGAITMASTNTVNFDELWPSLAGKQTCANEAAGKVSCVT